MAKERERTAEVTLNEGTPEEKKINIVIKKPTNSVMSEAQRVGALTWTKCVQDGVMTKKELENFMKKRGIWSEDKEKRQDEITKELSSIEKQLYLGTSAKGSRMKLSKGRDLAIEMRRLRIELRDLLAEKIGLESNTAESLSENAKFDFMVSRCTFNEEGKRVYSSIEEYNNNADDEIAWMAAATLAEMLYSLDKDFEEKLPENQFLKKFKLVDDELSLVNKEGHLVDVGGELIDSDGRYINEDGGRVDKDGNPIDDDGNYIYKVTFLDDDGKPIAIEDEEEEEEEQEEAKGDEEEPVTQEQDTTER